MKLHISILFAEPNEKDSAKKLHRSKFKAHSQASDSARGLSVCFCDANRGPKTPGSQIWEVQASYSPSSPTGFRQFPEE